MRQKTNILFIIGSLVALIVGFAIPGVISTIQDSNLKSQVIRYESDTMQFRTSDQITDNLQLMANGYSLIELNTGKVHNANDAYKSTLEVLKFFKENGMDSLSLDKYVHHEEKPYFAVSKDKSVTAVIWQCRLYDDSGNELFLMLDDNSGKMLSFMFVPINDDNFSKGNANYQRQAYDVANRFAGVCALYYGFEVKEVIADSSVYLDEHWIWGTITFSNVTETLMPITFLIDNGKYSFNERYFAPFP